MRLLPCGPGAVLAEYDSLAEVMAVNDALRAADLPGVDDVVPAARTVLVQLPRCRSGSARHAAGPRRARASAQRADRRDPRRVRRRRSRRRWRRRPTCRRAEVIEIHSSVVYSAAFLGFTPAGRTSSGCPRCCTCHVGRRRALRFRPVRSRSPTSSPACTRPPAREVGTCSATRRRRCSTSTATSRRWSTAGDRVRFVPT